MNSIEEIKQRLSIVDVVGQYVTLKKSGRNYKGVCPFHSEKTPSFMVSEQLGIYKCFGCAKSGDIFGFIQEIEGVDFPQALKQLADKAGVVLEDYAETDLDKEKKVIYEINHTLAEFYHFLLTRHSAGKIALAYLKESRKLTDETIKGFNIGFAPDSWDLAYNYLLKNKYLPEDIAKSGAAVLRRDGAKYIDKFRNRIMFPFFSIDGKVIGFTGRVLDKSEPKYLNSNESAVFHKSSFVYALDKARLVAKKEGIVLVEGQMDVIAAHQAGFKNVVAATGTSLTDGQLKVISRYTKDLVFCFDSDIAGSAATARAISMAEKEGFNISVSILPEKCKDLDEAIKLDLSVAEKALKNTIPAYDFYLVAALKRHDKNSSIGQKKIIEELAPIFSQVTNKVTLDHYVKKISEELNISEDVVSSYLSGKVTYSKPETDFVGKSNYTVLSKHSFEAYLLALLFKTPLDILASLRYFVEHNSLTENDFTDPRFKEIFKAYNQQISGSGAEFDINYLSSLVKPELQGLVNEIYLWDLEPIINDDKMLINELNTVSSRIIEASRKRQRQALTEQIKRAELEKNEELRESLTKKFKDLS